MTGREEKEYQERSRNDFIFKFEPAQNGFFLHNIEQVRGQMLMMTMYTEYREEKKMHEAFNLLQKKLIEQ